MMTSGNIPPAIKSNDTVIKSSHIGPDGWMDTRYFASRSHKTQHSLVGTVTYIYIYIVVRDRKEVPPQLS